MNTSVYKCHALITRVKGDVRIIVRWGKTSKKWLITKKWKCVNYQKDYVKVMKMPLLEHQTTN